MIDRVEHFERREREIGYVLVNIIVFMSARVCVCVCIFVFMCKFMVLSASL